MPDTPRSRPARRSAQSTPQVEFEPLVPQPAYGRVAAAIEQRILDRRLRPGDPLPTETDLARQFGVNRSTVREALRRLESGGLVGRDAGAKRLRVTRPARSDTASRAAFFARRSRIAGVRPASGIVVPGMQRSFR